MPRRLLYLALIFLSLSSCFDTSTTRVYNRSMTRGFSSSAPIRLSFKDKSTVPFYLLLERTIPNDQYLLKVRWICYQNYKQFNGMNSTVKFLIDREEIVSLSPIKLPKTVSYNIEDKTTEEEAQYVITRAHLERIASAKSVTIELTGKYSISVGSLNKFQSFRAIKDFLLNG